jgi:hypothetical protein
MSEGTEQRDPIGAGGLDLVVVLVPHPPAIHGERLALVLREEHAGPVVRHQEVAPRQEGLGLLELHPVERLLDPRLPRPGVEARHVEVLVVAALLQLLVAPVEPGILHQGHHAVVLRAERLARHRQAQRHQPAGHGGLRRQRPGVVEGAEAGLVGAHQVGGAPGIAAHQREAHDDTREQQHALEVDVERRAPDGEPFGEGGRAPQRPQRAHEQEEPGRLEPGAQAPAAALEALHLRRPRLAQGEHRHGHAQHQPEDEVGEPEREAPPQPEPLVGVQQPGDHEHDRRGGHQGECAAARAEPEEAGIVHQLHHEVLPVDVDPPPEVQEAAGEVVLVVRLRQAEPEEVQGPDDQVELARDAQVQP